MSFFTITLSSLPQFYELMSANLFVKDGTVTTSTDQFEANIVVDDGEIQRVTSESNVDADHVIDASGKLILPGLINTHVHFRDPGQTHKEDFESGSKTAAAGGYTMFMDMPNCTPITNTLKRYQEKCEIAGEKSIIDHNSWAGATDPDEVSRIYEGTGNLGFKIFMHRHPRVEVPYNPDLAVYESDRLFEIFRTIAGIHRKVPVSIHPSDVDLADKLYEDLVERGATDYKAVREGKDGVNMTLGAYKAVFLAHTLGLEHLNILHIGMNEEVDDPRFDFENHVSLVDLVRDLKDNGWQFFAETEGSTFLAREEDEITWDRRYTTKQSEKLWEALRDGTIDIALTEHAPHLRDEANAEDAWDASSGMIGAQDFLPLMLTGINEGELGIADLVRMTSEQPAKFLGIYPKKGAIQVGADADLTIVDMDQEATLDAESNFHKADWSTYDGYDVQGMPTHTIVRGTVVYEEGEILVEPGFGEYVHRDDYWRLDQS